jgi:predicted house-cleaning NTP pyrophosphatase (Maf/HAM1 superfamily)
VQLFTRVAGDQFVVRGLPLLAVLGWLREAGEMPA